LNGHAQRLADFFEAAVSGLKAGNAAGRAVQGSAVPLPTPKQLRGHRVDWWWGGESKAAVHAWRLRFSYALVSTDQILLIELTSGHKI